MKKYLLVFSAIFFLLAGFSDLKAGVSDAAVLFLRIAAGARAAGMGETFGAVADDATATHWNPAGLGMYPLASEYHTYRLDYNPHIADLAMKILENKLDEDYYETYQNFIFQPDGIYRQDGEELISYEIREVGKDISILHYVVTSVNTLERDKLKLAVRAVAKENSGVSFEKINNQRLRLLDHFKDKGRKSEVNRFFENLVADWQELKVDSNSIKFMDEKITFALEDGVIDEKEYGQIMMVVDKADASDRTEKVKVPYSLLFSLWKDFSSPWKKNLRKLALVENGIPEDNYKKYDMWGLSARGLVYFDGSEWLEGMTYKPRSSTLLADVVYDQLGLEDSELLDEKKMQLAGINSKVSWEDLNSVLDSLTARIPENESGDLLDVLEMLKTGWLNLTLEQDRLVSFVREVNLILESDEIITEDIDRLTFLAARVERRRLPEKIIIPFDMVLESQPLCIEGTGRDLWVGTENGLFRYNSKEKQWRRYTVETGLPSNHIVSLSAPDKNNLWVAMKQGVAHFSRENWTYYGSEEGLNAKGIYLIYAHSRNRVWVVAERNFLEFNGSEWKDQYVYETAVNDTLSNIIRDFVGYTDNNFFVDAEYTIKMSTQSINNMTGDVPEPGSTVLLPMRYLLSHKITHLCLDSKKRLWMGTDHGVKIFYDGKLTNFGYKPYYLDEEMTIEAIARDFLQTENQVRIERTVRQIKDFNEITSNKLPAGSVVYIYVNPLGSEITALESAGGSVYIGTPGGLVEYSGDKFGYFYQEGLEKSRAVDIQAEDSEVWYATSNKVVIFASVKSEITVMHANWLPELADDIYYEYLSYIHHLGQEWGTIGLNVTFLSYGELVRVDTYGRIMGTFNSFDMAVGLSYGKKISNSLSAGLTTKWIYSRLSDQGAGSELGEGTGSSLGIDIGLLYKPARRFTIGTAITNLGPDISYIDAAQSDPLPRNLTFGIAYRMIDNPYNRLTIVADANKMLTGLDDGMSEELKEIVFNSGFEYWYGSFIAFRAGYIYDQVGDVKTPTLGVGLQYKGFRFDFAYIPSNDNVPLANTVRFSLTGRI